MLVFVHAIECAFVFVYMQTCPRVGPFVRACTRSYFGDRARMRVTVYPYWKKKIELLI